MSQQIPEVPLNFIRRCDNLFALNPTDTRQCEEECMLISADPITDDPSKKHIFYRIISLIPEELRDPSIFNKKADYLPKSVREMDIEFDNKDK